MLLRRRWLVTVAVLIMGVFGGTGHALSGVRFPVAHGHAAVPNFALHFHAGLGYGFGRSEFRRD